MDNQSRNQGYLVFDADGDGTFVSGVILAGCGQASSFDASNLI
jgi:hypothetical protein